jgi:hypothetical protein
MAAALTSRTARPGPGQGPARHAAGGSSPWTSPVESVSAEGLRGIEGRLAGRGRLPAHKGAGQVTSVHAA